MYEIERKRGSGVERGKEITKKKKKKKKIETEGEILWKREN